MKRIPLWQIDAFTDRVFSGNPAAVCLLEAWLPDATLAAIAAENNLSETAFLVKDPAGWHIRWFTPERRGGPLRPRHPGLGPPDPHAARARRSGR